MTTADLHAWIVQEVVRRLQAMAAPPASAPPIAATSAGSSPHPLGRLVTLECLRTLPVGTTSVIVEPRAVVTPAVLDHLRQHNITFVRASKSSPPAALTTPNPQWLCAATCPRFRHPVWPRTPSCEWSLRHTLHDVVQHVTDWLQNPPTAAIVYAAQPGLAACLLNRRKHVRAIVARDDRSFHQDLRSVEPNVVVIDLQQAPHDQSARVEAFIRFVTGAA